MRSSTTIRISSETRENLRQIAEIDGLTLDEALAMLLRSERQRRIGISLSSFELNADDDAWLDSTLNIMSDNAGG